VDVGGGGGVRQVLGSILPEKHLLFVKALYII